MTYANPYHPRFHHLLFPALSFVFGLTAHAVENRQIQPYGLNSEVCRITTSPGAGMHQKTEEESKQQEEAEKKDREETERWQKEKAEKAKQLEELQKRKREQDAINQRSYMLYRSRRTTRVTR